MRAQTLAAEGAGPQPDVDKSVLDITVLMGGPSSERQVSLVSGQAVADALGRRGHRIFVSDINPADTSALDRVEADMVFVVLHGNFGESGEAQQLCEDRRLPYVGSGPAASRRAMNKIVSKQIFRKDGLSTPDWLVMDRSEPPDRRRLLMKEMPPPCVLKPIDGGSSVDVIIARDEPTREAALDRLLEIYGQVLIEAFIPGREMTVGILGRQSLPVIEIKPAREFYDYYAKYQDEATQYIINPRIPVQAARRMQEEALKAFHALGCRDFARADFILAANGTPYLLEINTIPGFTSHSLLPKAAAAAGVDFDELCERLARMAMSRGG